ncbi:InlB B-repeat-containing protein [Bifidobacterium sp. MA2]|uniref:InlB B-repeat-containing protein n=1 Tax=Bifidobacterium santillanense TaxID=2809028 RepID=A0ABS5US80_9BIFI|nr:InlB B-repeat-containing protein [Bifidobacterium santillanense]MBT1173868.1 InlB B-repeat-containing protein [Bifidobacterium santillanense]
MTGNTSKWRAPLAGLASVAMLATMGVAASTANAATTGEPTTDPYRATTSTKFTVVAYPAYAPAGDANKVLGSDKTYGETIDVNSKNDPFYSTSDGKVFTGFSYDLAGKNKVADGKLAVKGDTKVYAQYAEAKTITFHYSNNTTKKVDVKTGSALTAADYAKYAGDDSASGNNVFAGWKTTTSKDYKPSDLYTDQAVNSNLDLYPVFEVVSANPGQQENVSKVVFHESDTDAATNDVPLYTVAGTPFPAYRVPSKFTGVEQWSADKDNSSEYKFTANVPNIKVGDDADLTLFGFSGFGDANWTVKYVFNDADTVAVKAAKSTLASNEVNFAEGSKIVEPNEPAAWDAEFTGWYDANGDKVDFNTPVQNIPGKNASKRTVTVHAGWDVKNIAQVKYYYNYHVANSNAGYADPVAHTWNNPSATFGNVQKGSGQAVDFVTKGSKINAPTGVEDYYKTSANTDHGDYTSRTVKQWISILDGAPISTVKASTSVYAQWTGAESLLLNANGGVFANGSNRAYATKTDGQTWKDVISTPTRDGFTFAGWYTTDGSKKANLVDGFFYDSNTGEQTSQKVVEGAELLAWWIPSEKLENAAALSAFPLNGAAEWNSWTPSFANKSADYKLAEKYAKTEASWKTYTDTVYDLQDEFQAYQNLSGQDQIDAGNKLAAKLAAAQAKLVDDKAPAGTTTVYRLFNPNARDAGSHHYTASVVEYNSLVRKGWRAEGVSFVTTSDGKPVYRAYNPNDGGHFYTLSKVELDHAVKAGWKDEGVAFRVSDDSKTPLYRIYNPNSGEHAYTVAANEAKAAVKAGWNDEGIAWNVIK